MLASHKVRYDDRREGREHEWTYVKQFRSSKRHRAVLSGDILLQQRDSTIRYLDTSGEGAAEVHEDGDGRRGVGEHDVGLEEGSGRAIGDFEEWRASVMKGAERGGAIREVFRERRTEEVENRVSLERQGQYKRRKQGNARA